MEHERELGCDDELATPWRRPTEIEGTGLEGTPFESTRAHNKEEGSANALCRPCATSRIRRGRQACRQRAQGWTKKRLDTLPTALSNRECPWRVIIAPQGR